MSGRTKPSRVRPNGRPAFVQVPPRGLSPEMVAAGGRLFTYGTVSVLVVPQRRPDGSPGHEVVVGHQTRHPTWEELRAAQDKFLDPTWVVAVLIPPTARRSTLKGGAHLKLIELQPGEHERPLLFGAHGEAIA